ncbi:hypothetical protein M9H77_02738 [Catharanthus roseus]|uniref:Uncharacterized protein n=1 Tax=Catharanthus roseus TaxID=4058 RepID=A0ACC0C9E8_CATRO|nr:hypothetical protein M9H77_02738 [Catharanthus roseus]
MDKDQKKIAPGHKVDLSDMQGMEVIPNLFDMIGWVPLLTVNELYPEMIYEFYANLHKGRIEIVENIPHQWVVSRIGRRDIAFDDRLLNTILETPQDEHMLATQSSSTKCFVLNLVGVGDCIGPGKIYNQHTFTRMGFEKNNEGQLVSGGEDDSDEEENDDDDEEQEGINVSEEEGDSETEGKIFRRETRKRRDKKERKKIHLRILVVKAKGRRKDQAIEDLEDSCLS